MIPFRRPAAFALMVSALLPVAAHAQLRPAVLPAEICLVLSNGPFDAEIAARIAGRGDFADILVQAETACPDLAGTLIGATATIPAGSPPDNSTGGPDVTPILPIVPPDDTATVPVDEPDEPPLQDDEEEVGPDTPPGGTNPNEVENREFSPAFTAEQTA